MAIRSFTHARTHKYTLHYNSNWYADHLLGPTSLSLLGLHVMLMCSHLHFLLNSQVLSLLAESITEARSQRNNVLIVFIIHQCRHRWFKIEWLTRFHYTCSLTGGNVRWSVLILYLLSNSERPPCSCGLCCGQWMFIAKLAHYDDELRSRTDRDDKAKGSRASIGCASI